MVMAGQSWWAEIGQELARDEEAERERLIARRVKQVEQERQEWRGRRAQGRNDAERKRGASSVLAAMVQNSWHTRRRSLRWAVRTWRDRERDSRERDEVTRRNRVRTGKAGRKRSARRRKALARAREAGLWRDRGSALLAQWRAGVTVSADQRKEAVRRAIEATTGTQVRRAWLGMVQTFWEERACERLQGWEVMQQERKSKGGETLAEATRYDWVCFRCGWSGWLVHAGKATCSRCKHQAHRWCESVERCVRSGAAAGEGILGAEPQGKISRRLEAQVVERRARVQRAIRDRDMRAQQEDAERETEQMQKEVLGVLRQGWKEGRMEEVVQEWRRVRNEGREQRSLEGWTRLEQGLAVQTQVRQLRSKMVGLVRRAERVVGVSEGAWRASEVTVRKVGEQCYAHHVANGSYWVAFVLKAGLEADEVLVAGAGKVRIAGSESGMREWWEEMDEWYGW